MQTAIENPNDLSKFTKLDGIEVTTATHSDEFVLKVKVNTKRGLPKLHDLPEFQIIKGHNNPIALIGGGPSIKKELENIKAFAAAGFPTIACGSSHDWLVSNGVIPTYCTLCDPDPITAAYLKKHNEHTKYLVALSCDYLVYEILANRKVYVWNCRSDEAAERVKDDINGHIDILGGCTVGLRSVPIAMCLGYTNIHFWGFDSCMGSGNEHHAYEFETDQEQIGEVYPIRYGDFQVGSPAEGEKYYMCSGYQLAQAMHFQQFLIKFGAGFTPTFHGEGLLTDYLAWLRNKAQELNTGISQVA